MSYTIPSLISLTVSVDVKHHERKKEVSIPVLRNVVDIAFWTAGRKAVGSNPVSHVGVSK